MAIAYLRIKQSLLTHKTHVVDEARNSLVSLNKKTPEIMLYLRF